MARARTPVVFFCTVAFAAMVSATPSPPTHVAILGLGAVGRTLVLQLLSLRDRHSLGHIRLVVRALADSSAAVGVDDSHSAEIGDHGGHVLREMVRRKGEGSRLVDIQSALLPQSRVVAPDHVLDLLDGDGGGSGRAENVIVVDCTASGKTLPVLLEARRRGFGIVLANKLPLAQSQDQFDALVRGGMTRYEATVGAGLPVIVALQRMLNAGDTVTRVQGVFSGTLQFITNGLNAGKRFSDVVRQAYAAGITEPDPRDDLSGADVARKILVVARTLGHRVEYSDIAVQPFLLNVSATAASERSQRLRELSVDDFLEDGRVLQSFDRVSAALARAAAARGNVLRYVAVLSSTAQLAVERGAGDGMGRDAGATNASCVAGASALPRISVGLAAIAAHSVLGRALGGTDNLFAISSEWYGDTPVVIQGAGAGLDLTAGALIGDIVDLATLFGAGNRQQRAG